ncbi:MAG: hypothetical protein ACETWM_17915 [Candidatus Lokiarchaeia archaeon]
MDDKIILPEEKEKEKKKPLWEKIVELHDSAHKAQGPEIWPLPSVTRKVEIVLSRNPQNWYAFCPECQGYIANVDPVQNGDLYECPCCGCEAQLEFSEAMKKF